MLTLEGVQRKTGVRASGKLQKYVATVMAAAPSSAILTSFNGFSLAEYAESRQEVVPDATVEFVVVGEAPDCQQPQTGPAFPGEKAAKIHGLHGSFNSMAAVLFVGDTGVGALELCNMMSGANRTPAFLAKNPFHQIPTYEGSDGFCCGESGAILRFVASNYGPLCYPPDPALRARIDWAMDVLGTGIYKKAAFSVVYPVMGFAEPPADQTAANDELLESMEAFEKAFLGRGKFVCGDQLSIADYKALPLLYSIHQPVVIAKTGFKLPHRIVQYVEDLMAAVKSAHMLESAGGHSLKEIIASKA